MMTDMRVVGSVKICKTCGGEPKPIMEFSRDTRRLDGLRSYCRACASVAFKKWLAANPEKQKASSAKWRAANAVKVGALKVKWRAENRAKVKASNAKYCVTHPETCRIHGQNRRARKRKAGGKLSKDIADRLFVLQRGKCACGCKQPLGDKYHIDHRMPIALGGTNTDDNIQLLRATCNHQKSAKHPIDFMRQRGFLL